MERELFLVDGKCLGPRECSQKLADALRQLGWQEEEVRSLLITRDIRTMLSLAEAGLLNGVAVNLGGIHHAPGRTQVRSYLYLDEGDRERLQRFEQWGATVYARDLPDSVKVPLATLLKE